LWFKVFRKGWEIEEVLSISSGFQKILLRTFGIRGKYYDV